MFRRYFLFRQYAFVQSPLLLLSMVLKGGYHDTQCLIFRTQVCESARKILNLGETYSSTAFGITTIMSELQFTQALRLHFSSIPPDLVLLLLYSSLFNNCRNLNPDTYLRIIIYLTIYIFLYRLLSNYVSGTISYQRL